MDRGGRGEDHDPPNGWTLRSLFAYFQMRVDLLERQLRDAIKAADKATGIANEALTARFEAVNEFRALVEDRAGKFMPRDLWEQSTAEQRLRNDELTERVAALTGRVTEIEARSTSSGDTAVTFRSWIAIAISVTAVIAAVAIALT